MQKQYTVFDPAWLVALAEEQWADEPCFAEALKQCTAGWWLDDTFIYFTPFFYPYKSHLPWLIARSVFLKDQVRGIILLQLLHDGRIGGIEITPKKKSLPV